MVGVFLDSTTDFTVDATSIEPKPVDGLVRALITSPSGTLTEAIVKNQHNGLYQCLYTPTEQGPTYLPIVIIDNIHEFSLQFSMRQYLYITFCALVYQNNVLYVMFLCLQMSLGATNPGMSQGVKRGVARVT